jgi:hypothetical protein
MYGDRLIKMENNELVKKKKYFIFRSYTDDQDSECDIFTGLFDYISIEQYSSYDDTLGRRIGRNFNYVHFTDIRNMVTLKKLKYDWSFHKDKITCYQPKYIHQKSMENMYFNRILKRLIGPHFTHYLVQDIKLDYELLEDNLVSDNTDYQLHEVFRENYPNYWFIMNRLINIFKKVFFYSKNYFKNKLY